MRGAPAPGGASTSPEAGGEARGGRPRCVARLCASEGAATRPVRSTPVVPPATVPSGFCSRCAGVNPDVWLRNGPSVCRAELAGNPSRVQATQVECKSGSRGSPPFLERQVRRGRQPVALGAIDLRQPCGIVVACTRRWRLVRSAPAGSAPPRRTPGGRRRAIVRASTHDRVSPPHMLGCSFSHPHAGCIVMTQRAIRCRETRPPRSRPSPSLLAARATMG
jgi:hypothetical protein